ncbi:MULTISPECIES: hypothetical protein [unclassified Moorena]|uniref:hypothetical protein n=1 Tax=unclassified Moorena TaxID=2683338 RepID=UPI0025E81848|nr:MULTISPECIES: hypothetical protein [unclassified Moorena]
MPKLNTVVAHSSVQGGKTPRPAKRSKAPIVIHSSSNKTVWDFFKYIKERESGTGNRESGTGNRESGIGNRESGIGNDLAY